MTTPPAHTPTPWTVSSNDLVYGADNVIRNCYPGYRIKGPHGGIGAIWNNSKTNTANAAHIVRCVNEREELLAVLTIAKQIEFKRINGMILTKGEVKAYRDKVDSVLARAREGGRSMLRWHEVTPKELREIWAEQAKEGICYRGRTTDALINRYGIHAVKHKMGIGWFKLT